jgi:hypothetical protein
MLIERRADNAWSGRGNRTHHQKFITAPAAKGIAVKPAILA